MERQGIKKGIYILPNLFTTANLFCGFFAVIRAINDDFLTASWMILLAAVFDFLDGRVARFAKAQSEFGLEYDSLVDVASFGLAPAVLMYKWALFNFGRFGWAAAFLFFACGALRLARFNVQVSDVEKKRFQGLPIPAAACCLTGYVIFYNYLFGPGTNESYLLVVMTFVIALLMVSNVPYRSFKELDKKPKAHFFFLVLLVGALFVIVTVPQVMIFVLSTGYIVMGIIEEVIRSPKRIAGIKDFFSRYFHAHPYKLEEDSSGEEDSPPLKVIEMGGMEEEKKDL